MAVEIDRRSWLNFAELLQYQGTIFWDTPELPEIVPQDNDTYLEVDDQYEGRPDLIAFDKYGDVHLWWVIALANNLEDLPGDVAFGKLLRIPNKAYVESLLAKGRGR